MIFFIEFIGSVIAIELASAFNDHVGVFNIGSEALTE